MLIVIVVLVALTLLAVMVLLVRKPAVREAPSDVGLALLLSSDLPGQMARVDARSEILDGHLSAELTGLRSEAAAEAVRTREAADAASTSLRKEVLEGIQTLGETLHAGLDRFRADNKTEAEHLRTTVDAQLASLTQRFSGFTTDTLQHHAQSREALHARLNELGAAQGEHQEKLRGTVEARLDKLNENNAAKLEEMRLTVDEKLHATLQTRLTESFGQVTEQLTKVHSGLGEMSSLATGVGDLKRVLSNVKSRGIVGEFFLGQQLQQMFAPEQYVANARIKTGSAESVEYALKVPNGPDSMVLLAIDSKFPIGDWERLEEAYESGTEDDRKKAGAAFERAIRNEGTKICAKYIDPPTTLPFAIMYLPTEALYAEVMRRPGLHAEVQSKCNVVIAGPSAFTMILTSFQLVFRTMTFQKNLNQVWDVFQVAQKEFERFGGLLEKVEGQVGTVQRTLKEISGKSKTVNQAFRNASRLELGPAEAAPSQNVIDLLAAAADED